MKEKILNTIDDLASNFLYYDRNGDEYLSMDDLNEAVKDGIITVDEMVERFIMNLENTYNEQK